MRDEIPPSDIALAGRLIADTGVSAGALMVPRAELLLVVSEARMRGALIALAEACGERFCRVCGCTELATCRAGDPCWWVGPDLCSACEPFIGGDA